MSVQKIYFIRHGETDLNREQRCQGRQNISLNDRGREQISGTAEKFKTTQADEIYSSPLERALESARIIADAAGLSVGILDWLVEIDHGELEGLNTQEADALRPGLIRRWHEAPHTVEFPGGETVAMVAERVRKGLSALLEKSRGTVLLVTHQVISGVARCLIEEMQLSEIWKDKLVNGDSFCFEVTPDLERRIKTLLRK